MSIEIALIELRLIVRLWGRRRTSNAKKKQQARRIFAAPAAFSPASDATKRARCSCD